MTATLPQTETATVKTYIDLFKPRVMSLVVFTGLAGLWLAPGTITIWQACLAIICIALNAGAAGAINMWYDADIDAIMERTAERPIPSGKVRAETALYLGVGVSLVSAIAMGLATNWVAAALLVGANLYYVVIYTMWLKRRTAQNIVIGGAAGAFPPMIGWAAVTGDVSLASFMLFVLIFVWTPPHFWGLALYREGDYAKAGIPMMPNVAGRLSTRIQILAYAVLIVPAAISPTLLDVTNWAYFWCALILSLVLVVLSLQLYLKDDDLKARQLFALSIGYLFLIFGLMMIFATNPVTFTFATVLS